MTRKFNPASYEGKPRFMSAAEKAPLGSFFDPMIERLEAMPDAELADFLAACLKVSQINCGWSDYAIAKLLYDSARLIADERAASADRSAERQDAAGGLIGEADESAVPNEDSADAPSSPQPRSDS